MRGYNEGMGPLCERHSQFITDAIRGFRVNLPWFETLPYMVCDHIALTLTAPCVQFILPFSEHELFVRYPVVAPIRGDKSTTVGFLRIADIVDYA